MDEERYEREKAELLSRIETYGYDYVLSIVENLVDGIESSLKVYNGS